MKWMIASDLHGSAYYCRLLLQRWEEEQADTLLFLGGTDNSLYFWHLSLVDHAIRPLGSLTVAVSLL